MDVLVRHKDDFAVLLGIAPEVLAALVAGPGDRNVLSFSVESWLHNREQKQLLLLWSGTIQRTWCGMDQALGSVFICVLNP
jgi:hypothetical protein